MSARWLQGKKSYVFLIAMMALGGVHLAMIFASIVGSAVHCMAFEIQECVSTAIRMCGDFGNRILTEIAMGFFNLARLVPGDDI